MSKAQQQPVKNATFRIPKSVLHLAKKRALEEERSLNEVIVKALEAYGGQPGTPGARLLADADRFTKARGKQKPVRHFTPDELHEREDA